MSALTQSTGIVRSPINADLLSYQRHNRAFDDLSVSAVV
jgi:hypothetical protein